MTDHTEDLEEFIDDVLEPADYPGDDWAPDVVERREAWAIRDYGAADWALRRVLRAKAEIADAAGAAELHLRGVKAYVERVKEQQSRTVDFFEAKLREFHERAIDGSATKTVILPSGKLRSSKGGVSTVVTDEAALLTWLRVNTSGGTIRKVEVPDLDTVKRLFGSKIGDAPGEYLAMNEATGEKLPGVIFVRSDESFKTEGGK